MMHGLAALLALWLVDPEATPAARFEQGRTLFDQGRYSEAAEIFVHLHAETGEASVLYAAGQSFRLARKCQDALAAYEGFVAAAHDVEQRTGTAPAASEVSHPFTDLDYARARVVEMRICAGRSRSRFARDEANHLASTDQTRALALLENEWQQTLDPTLLPALVRLQLAIAACERAAARLNAAIHALDPIETLAEAALPDSDVAAARDTLTELLRIKSSQRCLPGVIAAPVPVDHGPPPLANAAPPRAPWPKWTIVSAAVLIAAGGVSGALMYRTQSQLDAYGKDNRPWDARGTQLYQDGQRYQLGAIVLAGTGVVAGVAALLYRASVGTTGGTGKNQRTDKSAFLGSISAF